MMRRKAVAAAATGVALMLALAACTAPDGANPTTASTFDTADLVSETAPGTSAVDLVSWGLPAGEPPSLDPVKVTTDSEYQVLANLCENLLLLNPDFSLSPNVAASADWTSDTTFVVEVADGVTFWDGSAVTADDVAFSLQRQADPTSINATGYANVTSIDVTGPMQVTLTFSAHDSQFRNTMASSSGAIEQKAYTEANLDSIGTPTGGLMCTGPYVFDSWTPGDKIVTTANPTYWQGAPLVKQIDYLFISSDETLTNGLISGEIDGAFDVPVASTSTLSNSDKGELLIGPSTQNASLSPLNTTGPASNPAIRQALNLAIDKNAVVQAVLGGYGAPLKTFIAPLAYEGLEAGDVYKAGYDALPEDSVDIEKAKELVSSAGLESNKLKIVIAAGNAQWVQLATIVQAAGTQIGLDVEVVQLQGTDFASLFSDETIRAKYDLVGTTGYLTIPGPLTYSGYFVTSTGLFNWSGYDNPTVTDAWTASVESLDPTEAAEEYVAAQAAFAPDQLLISLGNQYTRVFLASDLTGITTSFAYISSPWARQLGGK